MSTTSARPIRITLLDQAISVLSSRIRGSLESRAARSEAKENSALGSRRFLFQEMRGDILNSLWALRGWGFTKEFCKLPAVTKRPRNLPLTRHSPRRRVFIHVARPTSTRKFPYELREIRSQGASLCLPTKMAVEADMSEVVTMLCSHTRLERERALSLFEVRLKDSKGFPATDGKVVSLHEALLSLLDPATGEVWERKLGGLTGCKLVVTSGLGSDSFCESARRNALRLMHDDEPRVRSASGSYQSLTSRGVRIRFAVLLPVIHCSLYLTSEKVVLPPAQSCEGCNSSEISDKESRPHWRLEKYCITRRRIIR